jgi:hypothetical protein
MNKIISVFGLIFCSSMGFSLKAKAEPVWQIGAMCWGDTWAIGYSISKARVSSDGTPVKINGITLECADLERSPLSRATADGNRWPPDDWGLNPALNWQAPIYNGMAQDFITGITLTFTMKTSASDFTEGFSMISMDGQIHIFDDRGDMTGEWTHSCGPGQAVNGLKVQSDDVSLKAVAISCSSYQDVIDARINAQKAARLESLRQQVTTESVLLTNDIKSASINKISFETLNLNITGAACAIAEINKTVYVTSNQAEVDSFVDLFTKTFGHSDWQSNAVSCDTVTQSIASYTGCIAGSLDAICLNQSGYLDIKSRLEKKLGDYARYRDEANAIGDGTVCLAIERLSQQALIDVGEDLSAKAAAGAFSGTCTGSVSYDQPVAEKSPTPSQSDFDLLCAASIGNPNFQCAP